MEKISFGSLTFAVSDDGALMLTNCLGTDNSAYIGNPRSLAVCEFDVAGGTTSGSHRMTGSAETRKLKYSGHTIDGDTCTLVQRSDIFEVTSVFTRYGDTNAVRIVQSFKNISDGDVCLETANVFNLRFGKEVTADSKAYYFHKFNNARYTEAMPDVRSLYDIGVQWENYVFHVENVGNASSCEYLPQGILENRRDGDFLMFQIESYFDWFYEISALGRRFDLQIGGPSELYHRWNKLLKPCESYTTVPVAIAGGKTLNEVLANMTKYRRHIKAGCIADAELPAIYNEYMHYSWDDPNADRVKLTAPYVAASGCKYYVVDCGWHDSNAITDTLGMYPKFGTWFEDRSRFPDGIKATAEYVRSLGMKFGLWIAPEVVGVENERMLSYYDDSCFFVRNGKRIRSKTGYLLDYRSPKVRDYMTKTLDRMIEDYGCDYIKFDGCPNPGFGTDLDCTSPGDGLEKHTEAFLEWVKDAMKRHPDVIFEDCAGGGQRIDYAALSMFSLVSTSDQTDYLRYPYISANICASVLPEQAAVWSYPVGSDVYDPNDEAGVNAKVSEERVVLNMINSLLGRIHLASRIQLLDDKKQALIREGIELYNRMTADKLDSVPYLPYGYTKFDAEFAASGIMTDKKLYLAVWNLGGKRHVKLELPEIRPLSVRVAYPTTLPTDFAFDGSSVTVDFTEDDQARLFEIEI